MKKQNELFPEVDPSILHSTPKPQVLAIVIVETGLVVSENSRDDRSIFWKYTNDEDFDMLMGLLAEHRWYRSGMSYKPHKRKWKELPFNEDVMKEILGGGKSVNIKFTATSLFISKFSRSVTGYLTIRTEDFDEVFKNGIPAKTELRTCWGEYDGDTLRCLGFLEDELNSKDENYKFLEVTLPPNTPMFVLDWDVRVLVPIPPTNIKLATKIL